MVSSYRDLFVFKKACELAGQVYRLTGEYPVDERYSLISQMRRAATSIPMNIAEGYRRTTRREYIRFLTMANGSCSELDAQLILSREIDLITPAQYSSVHEDQRFVSILLTRLIDALKRRKRRGL